MNPEEQLLRLVGEHWESIQERLDDEQLDLLLTRLRELADAPDVTRVVRRALQGVRLALLALPLDHPVRLALDTTRLVGTTPGPAAVLRARGVLVGIADPVSAPDTAQIIAGVRRRLLAAPSFSDRAVRARCAQDAPPPELIRLDDPVLGARYPAFQFEGGAGGTGGPIDVVRQVNRLLLADVDPWGAADWWLSGNAWLGGPPASLIGELPDEALSGAARALVEGD